MPLPVLNLPRASGDDELLRLFLRTDRFWADAVAETTQLDVGVVLTNPSLPKVWECNRVMEAALPPGVSPADAVREVEAHFAAAGVPCWKWAMNHAAPSDRIRPLADHLLGAGWVTSDDYLMALATPPRVIGLPPAPEDLMILPARAAFAQSRQLAAEAASAWNEPQLIDSWMLHLDDPHCDALLALRNGKAVASVTVLAVGDIGRIEQVYVAKDHRRQGIGRLMMLRALEICARSTFRHVLLSVRADNADAIALYASLGFKIVTKMTTYRRPL